MTSQTENAGACLRVDRDGRERVTVLVPCFNNEAYIERCLQTVTWADEILVVDSFSTDRTVEIASRYATRVLQHEYVNSATQKNWAIPQASNDWVLILDTDERIPPDLLREMEDALRHPSGFAGFRIARANIVFGRWLRHGGDWPDYQIRLFRKESGRYEGRQVHAHIRLDGPMGTLTTPIIHYPHRSLKTIRKTLLDRYSSWEAREKRDQGIAFRSTQLVTRPLGAFAVRYVLRQGFRDGWQGLLMATVWSIYVFRSYRKLRELERREG